MRRILFVDDEPCILGGLRDMLRYKRKHWEMVFAESGAQALDALDRGTFDVVVSDMRMPGMDGAALLAEVQSRRPETVRIILSGFTETDAAVRAVPVAHQFLTKPCERETLERVLERACDLRDLVGDERLRCVVGSISNLPSRPRLYTDLVELLRQPECTTGDIAALVEGDMAICAKMLQLVNSSFFGMPRQIHRVEDAVLFLGQTMLLNLSLSATAFQSDQHLRHVNADELQRHAVLAGSIARHMVPDTGTADDAFLAAVLHDVGVLILASRLPDRFDRALRVAREQQCPLFVAETDEFGVSHAELGAYLLGLWGMPNDIVEAVAFHHRPLEVNQPRFDLVAAVSIADALAHEVVGEADFLPGVPPTRLDHALVRQLELADRLPGWRALAHEIMGGFEEAA